MSHKFQNFLILIVKLNFLKFFFLHYRKALHERSFSENYIDAVERGAERESLLRNSNDRLRLLELLGVQGKQRSYSTSHVCL